MAKRPAIDLMVIDGSLLGGSPGAVEETKKRHILMRSGSYKRTLWAYGLAVVVLTGACIALWPGAVLAIVLCSSAIAVLTTMAGMVIRRQLQESIGSIRRAMDAAANGELDRRLTVEPGSKMEKMQRSFNVMAEKLRASSAELNDLRAKLERYQTLAEVGEASACLAHEIASPLDAAQDGLSLLRKKIRPDAEIRELLEMIESSLYRAESAARRLLVLTRAEPGAAITLDLREPIKQALETVIGRFRRQNIDIRYVEPAKSVPILADPGLLSQAFVNILSNAADAMPGGGRLSLTVSVDENGKTAAVQVSDTGCGIQPEQLGRIFEPFYTTKPSHAGTGLGLPIAKRIIETYHGRIEVHSQQGQGTCFAITLPLDVYPAAETAQP